MRREGFATWLTLGVAGVVLVAAALAALGPPTPPAQALDICGQADGTTPAPTHDGGVAGLTVSPESGYWGQPILAAATFDGGSFHEGANAQLIIDPATFVPLLGTFPPGDSGEPSTLEFPAPPEGDYTLRVCYTPPGAPGTRVYSDSVQFESLGEPTVADCDPAENQNPQLTLAYAGTGGPPGTVDEAVIEQVAGTGPGMEDFVSVVWGIGTPDAVEVALQEVTSVNRFPVTFTVPLDATPGTYEIGLCYFDSFDGLWRTAANTIQFTVTEQPVCGGIPPTPFFDEGATITGPAEPHSPGFIFDVEVSGLPAGEGIETAVLIQLVWDFSLEPTASDNQLLRQTEPTPPTHTFSENVPTDATPGTHNVGVCYLVEVNGEGPTFYEWRYVETVASVFPESEDFPPLSDCTVEDEDPTSVLEYDDTTTTRQGLTGESAQASLNASEFVLTPVLV